MEVDRATDQAPQRDEPLVSEAWGPVFTHIGQIFEGGVKTFRDSLGRYTIATKKNYKYIKNEPFRVTAICPKPGCNWKVHGIAPMQCSSIFILKEFEPIHNCADVVINPSDPKLSSKLVGNLIGKDIKKHPHRSTADVMEKFQDDFGIYLGYYYSYHGKKFAMNQAFGEEGDSYAKLKWYVDALQRTNPNSRIDLQVDESSHRFVRVFIALRACISGFKHCRPVIYIDATFAKTRFNGCILAAVTKDGNNGLFPIAYAIVDLENEDNWSWFLENLKIVVGVEKIYTFISDRHGGIINGVKNVFPTAHHSFCAWHIRCNLNVRLRNGARKSKYFQTLIFKAARALPASEYHSTVDQMVEMGGSNVTRFFESLNPETWADSFFPGERYGAISSQMSESFNSMIKKARVLPITAMLDAIRRKIMNKMRKHRDAAIGWSTFLCPSINDEQDSKKKLSETWRYAEAAPFIYEVYSDPRHSVDLGALTCSCRRWQVDSLPCEHAMLCIANRQGDVTCFFDPVWTTEAYRKTYEEYVYPVPNFDEPVSFEQSTKILPPVARKGPGRPRTNRLESSGNVTRKKRICRRCNRPAYHNSATCREQI